jgi:hypothetical protein
MPPPDSKKRHAAQRRTLDVAYVLAMLQPSFWNARKALNAYLMSALVVLTACLYVFPGFALGIRLADWRPEGRDVVRFKRQGGRWHEVPLTPTVIYVVERYRAERDKHAKAGGWTSEYLFVTTKGNPIKAAKLQQTWVPLAKRLRARNTVPRMLQNFCLRNLRKGGREFEFAARFVRGLASIPGARQKKMPPVSEATIARLVRSTDPFKDMERQITNEEAARRWLADRDEPILLHLDPHEPRSEPELVTLLRKVRWPRGRRACALLRGEILSLHGEALNRLLQDRAIAYKSLALVLKTSVGNLRGLMRNHFSAGVSHRFAMPRAELPEPEFTEIDLAAIAAVRETKLPEDSEALATAVLERACRHASAFHDMMGRGLLRPPEAARILGIRREDLLLLGAALSEGVAPELILLRKQNVRVPDEWWPKIERAYVVRPEEDTVIAFFCRLVKDGYPGGYSRVSRWCAARSAVPLPLTVEEEKYLAALAVISEQAEGTTEPGRRKSLVIGNLVELDRLVSSGKVGVRKAAKLIKVPGDTFRSLQEALRAGLTPEEATSPVSPVSGQVWQAIRIQHELAPDETNLRFYWRMRADHGYTGGFHRLKSFREDIGRSFVLPLEEKAA